MIDFAAGHTILVDKPYGWTSFQVTNFIKHRVWRYTANKKLKVGHAGTLDPLATGLVIVCTGKMTKQIDHIQAGTKTYKASILLGAKSASYDLETPVTSDPLTQIPSAELLHSALLKLTGEIAQTPPIFSAKQVNGKRAYVAARNNEPIVLQPNLVTIHNIQILKYTFPYLEVEINCSKGTYIRSIAHDLGKILGGGGVLTALRRTKSGDFDISDALTPQRFQEIVQVSN